MKFKILISLVVLLGFILRIWHVDKIPGLLYGDEQAFAWNAYSILKLGQDEYGTPFPLQFRSFNDYKAPIPVYLLVPFLKFFGLNPFAIRLPIVLASTIIIISVYFLAKLFFNKKISLLISFLLAISPWHIHLTRGYFESTLALLWFILGVYFFIKDKPQFRRILLSMTFFAFSLYSYFTPRILVPIFLIFLICFQSYKLYFKKGEVIHSVKVYLAGFLFLLIISIPLLKATFFGPGLSRINNLNENTGRIVENIVNRDRYATNLKPNWSKVFHNKATVWARLVKNNYLDHLSANFWYIYGDSSLRYFTGNMGMFYLIEFPFLIVGLYYLWLEKRRAAIFSIVWILLAPIPASIVGRPFAVRSLAILPAPFFVVGYGLYKMTYCFARMRMKIFLSFLIAVLFMFSMGTLLIRYYLEYPVFAATWWGWENKAALDFAKDRESRFDNIFISDFYSGSEGSTLAFAVYNKYDPKEYIYAVNHPVKLADDRKFIKFGKYYFGSLDIDAKRLKEGIIPPHSLYIGRPEEVNSGETINAPDDGRVIFNVYEIN